MKARQWSRAQSVVFVAGLATGLAGYSRNGTVADGSHDCSHDDED